MPMTSRRRFVAGTALGLASAGIVKAPARAAQFQAKCASNLAVDHPISVRLKEMWAAVEQETGGRFQAQYFPSSQLGGDSAMFSQLRGGALEFFLISPGNLASVVPAADISFLGFAFNDEDEGLRVMGGPLGEYIRQEAAAKGIYVLRPIWDTGMNQTSSSTHPIQTPEDLRGFKIRVVESRIVMDLFKGLGASPVPLNFGELYTSLQTKIVDGQACPMSTFESSRFYEVQKYISLTNHAWSGDWMLSNGAFWKSLPSDVQDVIERNHLKYAVLERKDNKALNAAVLERMRKHGLAINRIDPVPFRKPLRSYYEYWANAFGPTEWGLLQSSLGRSFL